MRIAEYKQIDTEYIEKVIHHEATEEQEAYDETITVPKAIMGMVYRDATPEEIAQAKAMQVNEAEMLPSAEERLEALEQAMLEMMLGGAE